MKLIKSFNTTPSNDSVILLAVVRDEQVILKSFLNYYAELGVTHFIFVNNSSTDSTEEILMSSPRDICLYNTSESYAENDYGVAWVRTLLDLYCKNKFCIVVDADEFLLPVDETFVDIKKRMRTEQVNVMQSVLVEFYPKRLPMNPTSQELNPFEHSNFYESVQDEKYYFVKKLKDVDDSFIVKGGVRSRVFEKETAGNDSCCLSKKSIFIYDFYETHFLSVGMHWILPKTFNGWGDATDWKSCFGLISFSETILPIAHFKYVKFDYEQHLRERVSRNEDYADSSEYKMYLSNYEENGFGMYDGNFSKKYINNFDIYNNTVVKLRRSE